MSNPTWTVTIDPAAAIEGRTELSLNTGAIQVTQEGIDWGESLVRPYLAEQEWGETPVSFRVPNRVVSIPLFLGAKGSKTEWEARQELQQKVGQLQREGGVLYRQRNSTDTGSAPMYADIMTATLKIPDVWGETAEVEPNVILQLECLPDFYGAEVELEAFESEGEGGKLLKKSTLTASITGDHPARAVIKLENKSAHSANYRGLLWGVRCKNYSSALTAATFLSPAKVTPVNGAAFHSTVSEFEYGGGYIGLAEGLYTTWMSTVSTDISGASGGPCTHVGSYQVWARVIVNKTSSEVRLAWSLDDATVPTYNEAVAVPVKDEWCLVNLGQINIEKPPTGEHWWRGFLQFKSPPANTEFAFNGFWLQPLDEAAGILRASAMNPSPAALQVVKKPTVSENSETYFSAPSGWINAAHVGEGVTPYTRLQTFEEHTNRSLFLKTFGFSLPSGAFIHGLEPIVTYGFELGEESTDLIGEFTVKMVREGTAAPTAQTQVALAYSGQLTFGGPTSLWGDTWSYSQMNAATTGVAIWGRTFDNIFQFHKLELRVYYTLYETELLQDAVIYLNRGAQVRTDGSYREDLSTGAYVKVSTEQGNLLRLPPSGLENKPVELFVRPSPGNLETENDLGKSPFKAQVFYSPTWLGRP